MDSAPDWVGRKFPDAHYVAIDGYVMKPQAAPGYYRAFFNVPVGFVAVRKFNAARLRQYKVPAAAFGVIAALGAAASKMRATAG